jgi:hypothetical protein
MMKTETTIIIVTEWLPDYYSIGCYRNDDTHSKMHLRRRHVHSLRIQLYNVIHLLC